MKLLSELRKKYKLDRTYLKDFFGCKTPQAYDNIEKKANYYSIAQVVAAYELFKLKTNSGAAEFIDKLKKEVEK
jgi:hypothetical protein